VRDPTLAESFDAVDGDCPADARERFLTLKDEHHVQETDKPKAATNFHRFPKNTVLDCDGRPLPERQESETIATMQVRAIQQRNGNGSSSKRCNPLFRNILRASDLQSIFCGYRSISFELNPSRINILLSSIPNQKLLAPTVAIQQRQLEGAHAYQNSADPHRISPVTNSSVERNNESPRSDQSPTCTFDPAHLPLIPSCVCPLLPGPFCFRQTGLSADPSSPGPLHSHGALICLP
jgi:hypothetical protein